jgi:hypothetical protein
VRVALATTLTLGAALVSASPAFACAGRAFLSCGEKTGLFADAIRWNHAFVLDTELFEAPQVHVYNPALQTFWRYETSTAGARNLYESFLIEEFVADTNFENIAVPPVLRVPVIGRSGIIDRRTASTMTRLLQAEARELAFLQPLDTSLDRAQTAFFTRGRTDWVRWQLSAAAGYARKVANAIDSIIPLQRALTKALMKKHRPYGVGSTDLTLAQRRVRRQGFTPRLADVMKRLGLEGTIPILVRTFVGADFRFLSFNVSQVLSQSDVIASERQFQSALRHFASRQKPASKPPS